MKTHTALHPAGAPAPIVALASAAGASAGDAARPDTVDGVRQDPAGDVALQRARAFAEPLLAGQRLDTGEEAQGHADGVAAILQAIGGSPALRAAAYLVYAGDHIQRPEEVVAKAFGSSYASLVTLTRKLVQVQRAARAAVVLVERRSLQTERVRKMLLAFSRDLRVVLLRLASRLQTLRWHAATRSPCPVALAQESLEVFAPLANRLGIGQIKWEIEDLAFRFMQPQAYRAIAAALAETRLQREAGVEAVRQQAERALAEAGLQAQVQGRPKHLYSIHKKMQGKGLSLAQMFDMRALRVLVADVPACYAALARLHERFRALPAEYDDYIARPKPNGYQSLHSVVLADDRQPIELQIRSQTMHEYAEHGVAAHWAYKEAGTRGYAGVSAAGDFEDRVAQARKAVLRQLLAWEREFVGQAEAGADPSGFDDRIYVFTPQAAVIELAAGATPLDFAYALHSEVGHRCRGAKVDGVMVPLSTPLANGQTVEVVTAKEGGPSLDWLNAELGFLAGARARSKVRAWFNAQALEATIARGREQVEKLLQREGRTALRLDDLAAQLGFKGASALFEVVGKDEFSLRNIEQLLRPAVAETAPDLGISLRPARRVGGAEGGGVLVVGVESLMTSLARCCRPAPPDAIGGYVTRGKGVAIHRASCSNWRHMAGRAAERVIAVAWGANPKADSAAVYPVDVLVEASDRPGLLRDISELFVKEKLNVIGVNTQSMRGAGSGSPATSHMTTAHMSFTVEVGDATRLASVLRQVAQVAGVRHARRR